MAGTLELNARSTWMPAGWIYDGVLQLLADELRRVDPGLSETLRKGLTESGGYCDLGSVSPASFRNASRAAEAVLAHTVAQGAAAFHDPAAYPAFTTQLSKLLELIHADAR